MIDDAANDKRADFALNNGAEVFGVKHAPRSFVKHEDGVFFASYGLNAVQLAGDGVIFTLLAVVYITVVVVVGCAKPENESNNSEIVFGKLLVL